MTSKESLELLKMYARKNFHELNTVVDESISIDTLSKNIEKDLEVLELLKPIIKACYSLNNNGLNVGKLVLSVNNKNKIKEWLEE